MALANDAAAEALDCATVPLAAPQVIMRTGGFGTGRRLQAGCYSRDGLPGRGQSEERRLGAEFSWP